MIIALWLLLVVLAVAGFSDWLDGYIARTYKQEVRVALIMTALHTSMAAHTHSQALSFVYVP